MTHKVDNEEEDDDDDDESDGDKVGDQINKSNDADLSNVLLFTQSTENRAEENYLLFFLPTN